MIGFLLTAIYLNFLTKIFCLFLRFCYRSIYSRDDVKMQKLNILFCNSTNQFQGGQLKIAQQYTVLAGHLVGFIAGGTKHNAGPLGPVLLKILVV